ncbi:hypothetical protein [Frankia sp. Cj5]|nr:hypothetical protein [Frankia sp. Cj5]
MIPPAETGHLVIEDFSALLDRYPVTVHYRRSKYQARREFIERWPNLKV